MNITEMKAFLSPEAAEKFDDVNLQRVLGASTHIRLIGDLFLDIDEHIADRASAKAAVSEIARHFTETRGASSQAISNAIAMMTAADDIRVGVEQYRADSEKNAEIVRSYYSCVLKDKKSLMLFDYSSTVAAAAKIGRELGISFDCYIPESRGLDGGRPYVEPFLRKGHKVHFFPDAAIYHFIQKCDICLIGSETFYPDGTCFNTVGSELAAMLCHSFRIPFCVPTPMIKVDMRALQGYAKPPIIDDHKEKLSAGWDADVRDRVDFLCPELVPIPPEYITMYITEKGILPPWAIYPAAVEYAEKLGRR